MSNRIKCYKPRPPTRRDYVPKPADPGQRVTWAREISGHWTGPIWGEGTWVPGHTLTRAGTIWSDGPFPRSSWVQPDDAPAGDMALIRYSTPREARWQAGSTESGTYPATWQHDAIRRAEHVRQCGSIYATVDSEREVCGYGPRWTEQMLTWHCDPACSAAAGKDRRPGWTSAAGGYSLNSVVDILTGRSNPCGDSPFCRRCIYLSGPAEITAA